MAAFIDPRSTPIPGAGIPPAKTTSDGKELSDLQRLCREERLYGVERWIQAGKPLQLDQATQVKGRHVSSALEIALEHQNHALVLLLLCNGYDPNRELYSPLDLALRARRWDLLDLLLDWGADPQQVDLDDLVGTYSKPLMERFRDLGVDLTADHALAEALAHHTSNKPLFGFAKRHRIEDPRIQQELNVALAHHAAEGNEKGVHLCLWAGADPHVPGPILRFPSFVRDEDAEGDDGDHFRGWSAVHEACSSGQVEILEHLGPDPRRDDFDDLYCVADSGAVVDVLARRALPKDVGAVISWHLSRLRYSPGDWMAGDWRHADVLQHLFQAGALWERSSADQIAGIRQMLVKVKDSTFVDLLKLFAQGDYCSSDILKELGRTAKIRECMRKVGFFPPADDDPLRYSRPRPTRSREVLSKFGVELPKPKKPEPVKQDVYPPGPVHIGARRESTKEVRLDRAALFKRVWSEPAMNLAAQWGLSGPGLAKACKRLQIPVPPRGYWARLRAGQHPRRPRLAALSQGEAEEIVVWATG